MGIIFSEPDRTSLGVLQKEIYNEFNVDFNFNGLPEYLYDNDKFLVQSLQTTPVVLGYKFLFNRNDLIQSNCYLHPLNGIVLEDAGEKIGSINQSDVKGAACGLNVFFNGGGFFRVS